MTSINIHEFTERALTLADLPVVTDLFNEASMADLGVLETDVDEMDTHFRTPGMDLTTDTVLIESRDGKPVGFAEVWDVREPRVRAWSWIVVHPNFRGQGFEQRLVHWIEERGKWGLRRIPDGLQVCYVTNMPETNLAANQLFVDSGWNWVRQTRLMRIEMNEAPQEPAVSAGIEIRAVKPGEESPVLKAMQESFLDHWGGVDEPFETYNERMMGFVKNTKDFDYSLWFAAYEGDQVCGTSLNLPKTQEDPGMGWVNTLGVRRAWRKQGIGLALLQKSFSEFYRRGTYRVGLGVDASSLTGATRLYERAGMKILRAYNVYEKEIRAGKDLTTRSVGA